MTTGIPLQTGLDVPLGDSQSASVRIDFGAGELRFGALPQDVWKLATGTLEHYEGQDPPSVFVGQGPTASLTIRQGNLVNWNFWVPSKGVTWDIQLNSSIPMNLEMYTGASKVKADLAQLVVHNFRLETGASESTITLPAHAQYTSATIKAGAADLTINIPAAVEARISVHSGLASVRVDPRFRREERVYQSDGYAQATNRLDLNVEVGVSSVNIVSI